MTATTEPLRQIALDETQLAGAVGLVAEAGWNQTADDWRLMIRHGNAIGFVEGERLVASGLALPYPTGGFAWISMILVAAERRRRGLATRIMQACMARIAELGLTPVLDATPAGETVYAPLGFAPVFRLSRYEAADPRTPPDPGDAVRPMRASDLAALAAFDREAFGADRRFILDDLLRRAPDCAFVASPPERGFVLARPGRTALQIGPLVADRPDTAARLFAAATRAAPGRPLLIDMPDRQHELRASLETAGFRLQRPYTRMTWPERRELGDPARTFAIAGPELG